ncbi:MAG: FAD-dependent oxidoreductase [Spirochaetota bacterium]
MELSYLSAGKAVSEKAAASFEASYDVIVAGLGSAGVYAAIAAARAGLRVLGIERLSSVYGQGSSGGMMGYCAGSRGGIYEEIDAEIERRATDKIYKTELFRIVVEEFLSAAGVAVIFDATVIGVYREGKHVRGVRYVKDGAVRSAGSQVLIDATAEAEVAAIAGCETTIGRDSDGEPQPYSSVRVFSERKPDSVHFTLANFDAGYVFPSDPVDLSYGAIHAGALHLAEKFTEEKKLIAVAAMLGVREGRFIVGEETLRFHDLIRGNVTDKPLFHALSFHDNHTKDWALESDDSKDWVTVCGLWGENFHVPIPAGAFIPKGVDGILATGRCMAFDHDMAQSVRMRRDMHKLGEVSGSLAALSVKLRVPLKKVPHAELLSMLTKTGCANMLDADTPMIKLPQGEEAIRSALASGAPGLAIWAAYRAGSAMKKMLVSNLAGSDKMLRRSSAFALALLGDKASLPVLRETVSSYDETLYTSRNPQKCAYAAVYLLGRMNDAESIPLIFDVMETHPAAQDVSYGVTALLRIGRDVSACRKDVAARLSVFLSERITALPLPMQVSSSSGTAQVEDLATVIRLIAAKEISAWELPHTLVDAAKKSARTFRERRLLSQIIA